MNSPFFGQVQHIPRIAHFSPLPPQRSGIADYCAELLPHLAAHMTVDVYAEHLSDNGSEISLAGLNVRPVSDFLESPALRNLYEICVYQMGNHPAYHDLIYQALVRYPGITVLHEFDLQAFHLHRSQPYNSRAAYIREMGYAHGRKGTMEARRVRDGKRTVPDDSYPLFNRVTDVSLGLIVHTEYARRTILARSPRARIARIPLAVDLPPISDATDKSDLLEQYPSGTVVLASFGYIAPSKRIESILQALALLRGEISNFRYILIGEQLPDTDLMPLINMLGLSDIVRFTGFVSDKEFQSCLKTIDIGINLRTGPTGGEMSASLARLLASGRPTIVSNVGGFADLPDDCVVKINQDESEVDQLVLALRWLIADPESRMAYSEAARRYVAEELSFDGVAKTYLNFIHECLSTTL